MEFLQANMTAVLMTCTALYGGYLLFSEGILKNIVPVGKTAEQVAQEKAMSAWETLVRFHREHGTDDSLNKVTALVADIKCSRHPGA